MCTAGVLSQSPRGAFEEYDTSDLKTVLSSATIEPDKTAWFKESEGNLLAVVQGNRM